MDSRCNSTYIKADNLIKSKIAKAGDTLKYSNYTSTIKNQIKGQNKAKFKGVRKDGVSNMDK